MPCYAMLCCAWLPLFVSPSLPFSLFPFATSSLCPHTWPPCSSILLISPRVTCGFFVPSFSPSHVIPPPPPRLYLSLFSTQVLSPPSFALSLAITALGPVMAPVCWSADGSSGAPMSAWWECGGGGRWQTGETRGQGMTVVECRG